MPSQALEFLSGLGDEHRVLQAIVDGVSGNVEMWPHTEEAGFDLHHRAAVRASRAVFEARMPGWHGGIRETVHLADGPDLLALHVKHCHVRRNASEIRCLHR